jgi:hypothetical protein
VAAHPSNQESISFWQRTVRDPINLFTGVLAIFTIILAAASIYQGWQTQQSVEISKRALTDLERPYLFILDYNWLLTGPAKIGGLESGLVYSVANGGKLPAFIKGVKLGIEIGGPTPPHMDDEPLVHDLMTAPLIGAGEQRKVIQGFTDENGGDVVECQIRGGKATIPSSILKAGRMITKIYIEYDGPITTGNTTTACWEWHPVKYAFTQYGGPEHNQRT